MQFWSFVGAWSLAWIIHVINDNFHGGIFHKFDSRLFSIVAQVRSRRIANARENWCSQQQRNMMRLINSISIMLQLAFLRSLEIYVRIVWTLCWLQCCLCCFCLKREVRGGWGSCGRNWAWPMTFWRKFSVICRFTHRSSVKTWALLVRIE